MSSLRTVEPGSRDGLGPVSADAYVPTGLARKLTGEGDSEVWFEGAALVADVAGYSQLIETHSARGEDGIEQLSALLSAAFRDALEVVEAHGGEVVYFAGDALVCYWEATSGGLHREQAATCGRELLEATRRSSSALRHPLPLHVSVASGALWAARVGGGSGRWDLLFGGTAVRAAFAGLREAPAGQIRVSDVGGGPAAAALASTSSVGPAQVTVSHRDLLPAAVARRADSDEWTSEMRRVDCLFVRLRDLDEARPGELARFRRALFLFHEASRTASATGRLVIDDRGLTLVWVLGEPAGDRGQAADSPIDLAARLCERLRHEGFEASGGMAAGRAFCGSFGTARRREIVAVGTPMVLAARLMERAEGRLLVAGSLAGGRGAGFQATALAPLQLKGFARRVPVACVEVSREGDPAEALVGRREPLAAVEARFSALLEGRGGICFVTGAAGVGKSSLVRALAAGARRRGLAVSVGEAHGPERAAPYFAWRPIFRAAFAELTLEDPQVLRRELSEQIAALGRDAAHVSLLGPVFPLRNDQSLEMMGADRAAATRDLLMALLASRLPERQVLVLEDLHDMDSTSLGLLEAATRRFPGVLFVVTSRLPLTSEVAERLLRLADPVVALSPLEPADVAQLAEASFGMRLVPSVSAEICAKARGIPLYLLAYLRRAHDAAPATSRESPIADLPPGVAALTAEPDPVRGVLGRFFEDLSTVAGRAMKAASVVGERFTTELLAETLDTPIAADELRVVLDAMATKGILRPDGASPNDHHFEHTLIQQACYETIPGRQRRGLHGRVAAALARRLGPDEDAAPDDLVISLAHHYASAGDYALAVRFADSAALRACRQGAYREAIRQLDRCLESATQLPDGTVGRDRRVQWLRLRAEAAGAIGDRDGRRRDAEAAIGLAGARPPWSRVGSSVFRLLAAASQTGHLVPSAAAPTGAVELELAQIYRQLAIGAYFAGQPVEIAYNASAALHHARRAGRSPELADALASMGTCLGLIGFTEAGRRHLRAAVSLATELESDRAVVYAHLSNALFLMGLGDWPAVTASIETCQVACRRTGNLGDWGNAQALRFWTHHYQGDEPGALAAAEVLHEAARSAGNPQHQSWAARFRALCLARGEQWDLAAVQLEAARDLFALATESRRLVRPQYELVPVLADLAAARFELGIGVEDLFSSALAAFGRARRPAGHAVLEGYTSLARVAFARFQRSREAADLADVRQIIGLLGRYSRVFPIGRPQHSFWRGRLDALLGRDRVARSRWNSGLETARNLGMEYDTLALTRADGALRARSMRLTRSASP